MLCKMLRWIIAFLLLIYIDNVTCKKANKVAQGYTGFGIIEGLCLNVRSDRLVYRYRNESYVYVAFDTLKTGMVDVYSWQIITTTSGTFISFEMKEEKLYAVDFRKNVNRDHVIGGTNKRYQAKFKSRMRRKMGHCKKLKAKKKYCKLSAIQSVFVRIEMREVHYLKNPFEDDCESFFNRSKESKKKEKRRKRKKKKEGVEEEGLN